jgi:hypothetical protein
VPPSDLIRPSWTSSDSHELRILLHEYIGGPGQRDGDPNQLHLPLAGPTCKVAVTFRDKRIVAIAPGQAYDPIEWENLAHRIEQSLSGGTTEFGRELSFSTFRVNGSWRGAASRVQILPPPDTAPSAPVETAQHPFILEFPIQRSDVWPLTNYRRMREHRQLTMLLNVLLAGHTSLQPRRSQHLWAIDSNEPFPQQAKWVQQFFFAAFGKAVVDVPSPESSTHLEALEPSEYYARVGHDGKGLRVPADLDQSIAMYSALSPAARAKFDRAAYWLNMATAQWNISLSASFAALVSAVESLTGRGATHSFECPVCTTPTSHEVPGATKRFKEFLASFAPGVALERQRNEIYALRSGILHGTELMQLDLDLAFGWDPPWWRERELHDDLWSLSRLALRNWLRSPSAA